MVEIEFKIDMIWIKLIIIKFHIFFYDVVMIKLLR
jgi:hypothetical protein